MHGLSYWKVTILLGLQRLVQVIHLDFDFDSSLVLNLLVIDLSKTLAFGILGIMYVLNKHKGKLSKGRNPLCLVLSPTRELAQQVCFYSISLQFLVFLSLFKHANWLTLCLDMLLADFRCYVWWWEAFWCSICVLVWWDIQRASNIFSQGWCCKIFSSLFHIFVVWLICPFTVMPTLSTTV